MLENKHPLLPDGECKHRPYENMFKRDSVLKVKNLITYRFSESSKPLILINASSFPAKNSSTR
jgi:hypothetical protein